MSSFEFLVGEAIISVNTEKEPDSVLAKVGDKEYRFIPISENLFKVMHNGRSHIIAAIKHKDVFYIDIDSTLIEVSESDSVSSVASASAHHVIKDKVFAPMPGKIVKILVKKGDSVTAKQPLAIVEAMKMENQIISPASGRIKSVNFSAGDQVNTTLPIIELELEHTA